MFSVIFVLKDNEKLQLMKTTILHLIFFITIIIVCKIHEQ